LHYLTNSRFASSFIDNFNWVSPLEDNCMRRAFAPALAFLVALACAIPSYGQTGGIFGKIIDRDGKPIADAIVAIERSEVGLRYEIKSDKNGNYSKTGVDDGNYRLSVTHNGVAIGAATVSVSLGFRVDQNFDLRVNQSSQNSGTLSKAQREAEQKANTETQGAFNLGVTALTAKNYDEAIKQFSLAAERRPNLPVIFSRLGDTNMEAKKFSEAADAYKKASELSPDNAGYFYNLGIAATRASKLDVGKPAIEKAVQLDPSIGGMAFLNFGKLLGEKGQDKEAAEAFQRSIKQDPKGADGYYQLGLLYMKNADTMAASIPQFEKYLQLAPKGADAPAAKQLMDAAKASAPAK
jgi:tetratricopeptide (TPR) repeat protein